MLLPCTCPICAAPGSAPCGSCIARLTPAADFEPPPGVESARALVEYDDVGARLVGALKYRNARRAIPWLAEGVARLVPTEVDVVTWAPTAASRRRARGFDQAEALARAVARRLRRPHRRLLHRIGSTGQTGLARADRLAGPRFRARGEVNGQVLLVDDVITTGATVSSAAAALSSIGATAVHAVAIAHTRPDRTARRGSAVVSATVISA